AAVSVEGRIDDLKGSATPDLRVALEAKSLSQFDKLAGLALPALGPLALGARVGLDAGLVTLDDLALTLGGSDLAGSLTASLAGERPSILADLTGARVDLSDFASAAAEQEAVSTAPGDRPADGSADQPAGQPEPATSDREAAGASPFVIPDTPLPLAALQAVDAEVALTLGELVVDPQTTLSDVALALRLENGRLEVSRLQAAAFEGRLDATLSLDAGQMPPALATRIDVEGLSLGKVTRAYAGTRDLESSLDLALDLQGRGDSPRALAASLNGSSEIVGGEGVVTNRILAIFASGLDEILGPLFGGRQETRLNCLVSRFRFEDGRAISQAQLVDSSTFSLAGTGTIDLRDERLDLKFDTRTREAALVSLAVPFVVTGTLADPRPAPDVLGSAMQVADFIKGGSNPLAALEQVVAGSARVQPAAGTNGRHAALEQTADVPASETPLGTLRQGLDRALQGEDPRKALEDAARDALGEDALGEDSPAGDALRQGLDSLFKRD
ncbi:MAG: AsmA family protein, partial [Tistlia sp.]